MPKKISTRELYEKWAENYDAYPNAALKLEEQYLPAMVGNPENLRVLDIGAGTGRWSIYFAERNAQVTAVEPSAEMRAVLARKVQEKNLDNLTVIDGGAQDFGSSQQYDVIIMSFVLNHVPEINMIFQNTKRYLKPDGRFFISENPPEFGEGREYDFLILENQYQVKMYRWTPEEIKEAAGKVGLEIVKQQDLIVDESVRDVFANKPHKKFEDFIGKRRGIIYVFQQKI